MITLLIVGLPGNMATTFTRYALRDASVKILSTSITDKENEQKKYLIDGQEFLLIKSNEKSSLDKLFDDNKHIIVVDYTEPQAVDKNIDLYCRKGVDFVMGTTGVVVNKYLEKIKEAGINAVISPNMGKQIVAIQAMLKYVAENFPECFKGYALSIDESHQKGKLDISGTARAMVEYFKKMGIVYNEKQIVMHRDPEEQLVYGVPKQYINGHAWHKYKLVSEDETVCVELVHNVNGREIYAHGTMDSIYYLDKKNKEGVRGSVYTMLDVLKNT